MMTRILDFLRYSLISFEALWLALIFISIAFHSDFFSLLGKQLKEDSTLWKALYALPFVSTTASFKIVGKLRYPLNKEENKILYEWPEYQKIVDRGVYSIVLSIVCCLGIVVLWTLTKQSSTEILGGLYLAFTGVTAISAFNLYLSEQRLKEILTRLS